MSRHAPASLEQRRAHVAEHRLTPGTLALDTALDALAVVERHSASCMTKIRYQDPEIIRQHGLKKTVNPTRLRLARLDDVSRKSQQALDRAVARVSPEGIAKQIIETWLGAHVQRSTTGIDELEAAIAEAIRAERELS